MQPDNNKHKIFSKEELFKLIDEKKSLPPEADDFDKEALEGLSMLTDHKKIDGLNNSIDEVLRREKTQEKKKRNIYILSAAASLVFIIGLFFLLKDTSFDKKENELAENTKTVNDISPQDQTKVLEESPIAEKKVPEGTVNSPASTPLSTGVTFTATGEASGKSEKAREVDALAKNNKSGSGGGGDAMAAAPTEVAANLQTKTENGKHSNGNVDKDADGKEYKSSLTKDDQLKAEDKEKDKKTRREVNTVWTTSSSTATGVGGVKDESKNKTEDYRSKKQDTWDGNVASGNNSNVSATPKSAEIVVLEKQSSKGSERKSKPRKDRSSKPDSVVTDMLAGYSYYDKKPEKGILQGGELEKIQQTTQPAQTKNEVVTPSTIAQKDTVNMPGAQKFTQEAADKKSKTNEAQPDNTITDIQNAEPKVTLRGNSTLESAEFTGGKEALQQYIKKNLKISSPKKSGTIVAEFVVNKDGKIDTGTVKITTKIKNCSPCSKDVVRLIKTLPKLKPATENGKFISRKQKLSVDYNPDKVK